MPIAQAPLDADTHTYQETGPRGPAARLPGSPDSQALGPDADAGSAGTSRLDPPAPTADAPPDSPLTPGSPGFSALWDPSAAPRAPGFFLTRASGTPQRTSSAYEGPLLSSLYLRTPLLSAP